MKTRHLCIAFLCCGLGQWLCGCEDDNTGKLSNFSNPGTMLLQEHCVLDNKLAPVSECKARGESVSQSLYVSSLDNGTIGYAEFGRDYFEVIDVDRAVPGVTSIATGDRPQSMASDALGALLLVTSPVQNDLSIISMEQKREFAYVSMDKPARRIWFDAQRGVFLLFMADGSLRSLKADYDCGAGKNIYTIGCNLSKDKLTLTWQELGKLEGKISAMIKDPVKDMVYVSFADKRYISALALSADAGACLAGTQYPCESARIGADFACSDGLDNDADGKVDSADAKCFAPWSAEGAQSAGILGFSQCNDGIDNNNDSVFDAFDPGCVASNDASEEAGLQELALGTCADNIDNDANGFTDRDDPACRYGTDNEDGSSLLQAASQCSDGQDNDADTLIDTADPGCYGRMGWSEATDLKNVGLGELGIDLKGRWLYVVDQSQSQIVLIDLKSTQVVNLWGRYPRNTGIGLPVNQIPLAVLGNTEESVIFDQGPDHVLATYDVIYVSSSIGTVQKFIINEHYEHLRDSQSLNTLSMFSPRAFDKNNNGSYFGVIRCLGMMCPERDLPEISYRKRPAIAFFSDKRTLSMTNPTTNLPHQVNTDFNIYSETWRFTYEGALESKVRNDGYFPRDGEFRSNNDFCFLGAREGDHLLITKRDGVLSGSACAEFRDNTKALEWEITEVFATGFTLKPIAQDGFVQTLPKTQCFTSALPYEVRAPLQWILSASQTAINRRAQVGNKCLDSTNNALGQSRFTYSENNKQDIQNAFFSIKLPASAKQVTRDFAYEFTTKTGQDSLLIPTGSASTDLQRFVNRTGQQYILIPDVSLNTVYYYNIANDSVDQEL